MLWRNEEVKQRRHLAGKRNAQLREFIVGNTPEIRRSNESQKAIAYCEKCIDEYEYWFEWNATRWLRWQKITIIGGVVATLAGVISVPDAWMTWAPKGWEVLSWIRGVPAAIVTIAASYLGSFTYREDAVRHELTANALWNELAKYQCRAAPYNVEELVDTSVFMQNICGLVDSELRNWSALAQGVRANVDQ